MVDTELQEILAKEVEKLIANHGLAVPGRNPIDNPEIEEPYVKGDAIWKNWNVYRQEKPYKTDENDDELENYVIVIINDEDLDSEGYWTVEMQFIVSIELDEDDRQGHIIIASFMNELWKHFKTHNIAEGEAELVPKSAKKRWNQESYPNYYEAALICDWKFKDAEYVRGVEELL